MSIVKGSKKASGQARQPNIAPDSAQSKTRINILYGLAEGEIEGLANGNKSILLENTPLEDNNGKLNFENVKVDFRSGTNDQDYIEGFPAVENETAVDVELKADTPWVKSFKNLDLDALRIRFKWGPLRSQDAKSGDVSGVTIEYAVDVQTDGGPWTEVLKTKISDKTSANYERAHRINLPKADSDWLVRVRRLTPNSTSEYISDKMYIEAVTEVIDAKLRYPNTALLGLQYDAETFNNVAKIAVECKGTKIKLPSNYNPVSRKYTGMWDGTFISAYSNNPAWIYYDICTSDRYGLGDRLTPFMIDKWSLYRLGQYCDEFVNDGQGEQEPRFTCNVYLQRAEEAYEILKKLAGVFRAISYWDGNSIICDADIPQDTYFTYTRANVIGEFEYSGTRARDRHNVVKVAFDNPANHYKTEYEYVRDEQAISDSGQVRILDLNAWGCTSRGQAQRAGLWALKSEQSETRTVTFKVGLDGWIPQPGRVIEIADELFAGRANGGRVSAISEDRFNLTIDRDDVIGKPGDRLVVNGENGKAQTRIIQSINDRVITVTLPFDLGSIAAENIWVIDAQDLATMKFRVISIRQEEKNKFTINAIQYNPKKFDEIDNGAHFEEVPISIINPSLQDPVSDISITSEDKVNQGINITTMILSWKQARGAVKYLVEWRKDNGSWLRLPLTGNNSLEVQGVYSGNYQARVTAISAFEVSSLPIYSSITELVGKKGLPPKLEFIRATGILFGMQLDWSFPNTGAQDAAYVEIRVSPDGASNIVPLGQFAYPTNTHKVQGLQPNLIQYYSGRIVDKIGNVGPWSDWVSGTTIADPEAVLDLISGHIAESDLAKELQGKIENTINVAEAAEQAANNAQTAASNAQTAATDAKTASITAQTAASTAQQAANEANVIAANAKSTADQASSTALSANTTATNAKNTANDAATAASKVASDLTTSTNQFNQKIADETSARTSAISQMKDGLTAETTQRKSEDASLLSNIETFKASTNGSLSSLQTQINTNATNTSANASKITSLDSRLTTNESKTVDAINAAATAQQTANTAVTNAASAASAVTALRSDLSGGKGINSIIAPFSDPQEISPYILGGGRNVALVSSLLRLKGKAYDVTFTSNGGTLYIGSNSTAFTTTQAAATVSGGKKYLLSMYTKLLDTSKVADFYVGILWFRRLADNSVVMSSTTCYSQLTNNLRVTPSAAGEVVTFKSLVAPVDAFAASIALSANAVFNTVNSRFLVDMLMLEETLGDDKSASMWVAGPADLGAIKSSLDANATAITNLTTRVSNDEGTITSQGQSIAQLNNSVTTINNSLSSKADASALNALTNRVTTAEGNITSQGNSITSLRNDLNTTNDKVSTKADSSALNSLDSKVTSIDGRVTSNTSAVTSLQSRVNTVENGLATKAEATALNNYYTKTEADSATSGAINTYNSQLSIGGVNVVANSEAPRTSTAATNKEYLMYERSAELKAFYDENLEKPITISFEMSTPVVGIVQVYSSNLSAHTFAISVNVIIPNQFVKYTVTVYPKNHTTSTTVSTIEFYGTYGTGRIPTIRKLQIESGNKATAWSPSPRDTKALIDVNASAIQTTQTKVDNIDGRLSAANDSITSLNSRMSNAEGNINSTNTAVGGLSTRLNTAEDKITNQSDSITNLQNSVTSINGTLSNKADSNALNNLTSRVDATEKSQTSQSGQITALNNSITSINGVLTTKADNGALQSIDSKVTNIGGKTDLNTSSITSLSSALNSATSSINMGGANVLADWILVPGTVAEYKVVSEPTALSGKVLQLGDNAGNDQFWGRANNLIQIDENKTYRLRARYRRKTGAGVIFLGVAQLTVDKSSYVTDTNVVTTSMSSSNYTIAGQAPALGEWQEVTCYLKGRSVGAASGTATINNPRSFAKQAYFISPLFIGNYNNVAGIVELDYLVLEDAEAIAGNLTNANAINTLNTNVSNIDGKVAINTNSITSLNSRVTTAENGITGANSAINSLSTRISDAEGKLTSQSSSLTQLSDQVGNSKSYSIVTFRNGSAVGIPRDGGIHSYKGKINGFGRGLNLIVFKNGDVSSVQAFDTYGDMATACTNLNNAIQALASGAYFAIVGTDNIGSVSIHAAADTLRTTLLACGASRSYLNTWTGNSLPIFVGRKDLDAGNGMLAMFDSSVNNQWIEYPLTFVNGAPQGMGDSRAITAQLDANASAISSLSNKVTQQGSDITTQSNAITSLNNSLAVSGKAGANLLIKSNVVGTYNGVAYPHVLYEMGEDWEVGAKYTLLWCAEHKRGTGDTTSILYAYVGGGMQSVQPAPINGGKVVNKVTFTKDGVGVGKYINFYMINRPTADKNSIGTVYWAVLVKGDLITTDTWVPSAYDYLPDTKANSTALNSLDSKVTNIDGRVTSNSSAITSLNSRIASAEGNIASNANAIANTYTKAQANEAAAGQINSFNSSLVIGGRNLVRNTQTVREGWNWLFVEPLVEPLVGQYTVSFDIENLDGTITGSGVGFRNNDGNYKYFWWPDSSTGHKTITINIDSTGFQNFGIYFNSKVRLKNVKVEKGSKETGWSPAPEDVKAGIDANASAISNLDTKVTQQGNSITSNSNSITSLSNTITNNDLTNWVRNANFTDAKNDWSSGVIVDATNAAPNPPSPKALALNYRDNYYGPMIRCNPGDMYYVSGWFASPVASGVISALGFHYLDAAGNHGWVGVVYTTEAKRKSWTMLEGYFTVPEGMVQLHPWLQVNSAADAAINEKWHVTNVQVRNITGNKKLVSDLQATSTALNSLSSRVTTTEGNITSQSSSLTTLTNQIGNTKSYSIVTFKNGSAASSMPKPSGIHSYKGRLGTFGRGLNLIVFNKAGDVVSCNAYDTYGDVYGGCNAIYAAINALASGTYFAIVGNDNIRDVGALNPDTQLRALLLSCGASDKYFRSWNWTALPIFIGRKDLDAGNGILGMFDSSLDNQWIEYPLVFVGGAPQGMGDSRAVTAQLDANAAAISTLSNKVTQQGDSIASQSQSLTSLNNSISGIYKDIKLTDTRNDNQPPTWYWQNHGLKIVREFKATSVLGLSGIMPDMFVTLETQVSWIDPSGGPIIQIARGSSSQLTAERRSADYNSWYPWSQDIKSLNAGLANKADASALSTLDSKVSLIDGKVSTQASSITTLQTSVGNNSASIQSQQQSIDGLRARATLKLQSGNLVGGVGIENDSRTVDFIVQANKFAIGAPSNVDAGSVAPKYAFVYQSTATTLPNGTVIPAGLYLDNASIGYINADRINANSLSALSANIGLLRTSTTGARTEIQDNLITVFDDNNLPRVKIGVFN